MKPDGNTIHGSTRRKTMKVTKLFAIASSLLVVIVLLGGCGGDVAPTATTAAQPAATTGTGSAGGVNTSTYIPIISKGFQHQFWQAVKAGSEKAAKDFSVKTTFEGPETEAQVDKQMEMLQAAYDKKPSAVCFAALDSKAAVPLLE